MLYKVFSLGFVFWAVFVLGKHVQLCYRWYGPMLVPKCLLFKLEFILRHILLQARLGCSDIDRWTFCQVSTEIQLRSV